MINFNAIIAKQIEPYFTSESVVASRLSSNYSFSGAKTVKVLTPITIPMVDYQRDGASRYGTPVEMQDIIQEMTLTQDKAFSMTIDKGNYDDQGFQKNAVQMIGLQMTERAIPLMDTFILHKLATNAGVVVANTTAVTKSNICTLISEGTEKLDDAEVPQNDRTLFLSATTYRLLKHSDEFQAVEGVMRDSIRKGIVGTYDNMSVVKVPKKRLPANLNFMIVHKNSAMAPVKLSETNLHENPPGISGNLLEGRQYYDCFVFGVKCDGIYVNVDASVGKATVCALPVISAQGGVISCETSGVVIKFTTDGSDPRYSPTAKIGSTSDITTSGTVVRAFAYKDVDGFYPSAVVEVVL